MVNYQLTKIYKITSNAGDEIYLDATAKKYLSQRLQQHRNDYKKFREGKTKWQDVFEIFDRYGVNDCRIVLIETFPCNSKDEKTARLDNYKTILL